MAEIKLELVVKDNVEFSIEGVIDANGKIVYTSENKGLPQSHGRFTLTDVYVQLQEFAAKNKYGPYKINISIKHG